MVFYATILHCKAILGRGQPGIMGEILTSSPARYHSATDAPTTLIKNVLMVLGACQEILLTFKHQVLSFMYESSFGINVHLCLYTVI